MKSINEVVESQLCTGCGACSYMQPDLFKMVDDLSHGRRPIVINPNVLEMPETLSVCPGAGLTHSSLDFSDKEIISELLEEWGPIYEVWEGYAGDQAIRFAASSGGVATALGLFCIEKLNMSGVLHTGTSTEAPFLNSSVFSTNRQELFERTGSRYSPASPCDGLHIIESSPNESVFIGKPCDVAAVQKAKEFRPQLKSNLGLVIGFFCAGVPSINGLFELMKLNGIDNYEQVKSLRFRGNGWPGLWSVDYYNSEKKLQTCQMTYADSWGFLQKYRQWRCYICPDHTGEFADIAVGDPWYREIKGEDKGRSLIVVRSERGREILRKAVESGYIVLEKNDPTMLPKSQPNLMNARGILWGRLVALKLLGAKTPTYKGFSMFKIWLSKVSTKNKIKSITGTVKRVFVKKLKRKIVVNEWIG